jgi:hypothetical protein
MPNIGVEQFNQGVGKTSKELESVHMPVESRRIRNHILLL